MVLLSIGYLVDQETDRYEVLLEEGVEYRIYVHPADVRADFNLELRDAEGSIVTSDTGVQADAAAVAQPSYAGPFQILVTSARGASRYALAVEGGSVVPSGAPIRKTQR